MSDGIKEILDNFKDYELRHKQYNENQFIIFYRDIHLLLDYITNLQTIEREYSNLLSENAELQQENDRLNNIIDELEKVLNYDINKSTEYMNRFIGEEQGNYSVHYYRAEWQKEKAIGYLDKLKELKENKYEYTKI